MINELEDELNREPCIWFGYVYAVSLLSLLMWVLV
jgi:hypothetical protein